MTSTDAGMTNRVSDRDLNNVLDSIRVNFESRAIDDGCFRWSTIADVTFRPESKLSLIEVQAFSFCDGIKMIAIPASVTVLGKSCFDSCESLEAVSFCAGSKLEPIPEAAFALCSALTSIIRPSSVKITGRESFTECCNLQCKLRNSPIPVDAQLVRIEWCAFGSCWRLKSLFLPSTIEVADTNCFALCNSLSNLTFDAPSHLRELLCLPPGLSGSVAIPDSVEILSFVSSELAAIRLNAF
jgi:hypothetical protein